MKLTKFFLVWIFSKCCSNQPETFSFNGLIGIIRFHMNIIHELVFSLILHLFLLYIFFWKVNTTFFSLVVFFINSQLVS